MADVGKKWLDTRSVECDKWGFSEEVNTSQLFLSDEFRLNVHGFLIVYLEQCFAVAPLSW